MRDAYDVAIVGCGPVGALAAALAAQAGLRTVAFDVAPEIYDLPRAIHFDAQIMRLLQQIGIADEVRKVVRPWHRSTFTGADGEVLRSHEFPTEEVEGWPPHLLFYQPELERLLRQAARGHGAELFMSTELRGFEQDGGEVRLELAHTGSTETVSAAWMIGCDGASSATRKILGIALDDMRFDEQWLVVDAAVVEQAGLPRESRMVCDPRRPSTVIEGRGNHRRWEFMLLPGEDPEVVSSEEHVRRLIGEWIEPSRVDIMRAAVYRFHGLVAHQWRRGRVFLAGDAAHQTPPFLGQGMCHGMRDAENLVWKLREVQAGRSAPDLLDSYTAERKPHVEEIIAMAVAAGRDICITDSVAATERDIRMRALAQRNALPPSPFVGMPPLRSGMVGLGSGAGRLFPQPTVIVDAEQHRLDDLIGARFALVLLAEMGIDEQQLWPFVERGLRVIVIARQSDPPAESREGGIVVTDPDDVVRRWMEAMGCQVAIVRPDRYVYASAGSVSEVVESLATLDAELCRPTPSSYASVEARA